MKTSVKTKIFCILLLLAMVLQMCPVFALADEVTDPETGEGDILDGGELGTEDGEGTEDGALDDGEEEIDYSNAVPVTSADELEIALSEGRTAIRIDADFLLDRTFYVEKSTVIVADAARVLKRAPTFGGDIFVVGEVRDGTMTTEPVVLTVGKPDDATPSMIVIDGNAENMTVDVVGTVFFVREASRVDLYDNLTVKNHTKTGNEKTLDEDYASKLSYHIRVGGAVAIVAGKASMRIYGGLYQNNRVNDITDADTDEGNLSSQGGVIYNYGTLDVYGGRFENNHAARAGVFYNYRTLNLYNAELVGNTASSLGGAIYVPASTAAYLYIGEENGVSESRVLFENNVSKGSGGAIYAQHVATVKNAVFRNNVTLTGDGGAIYAGKIEMQMDATVFDSNTASEGYGGALYITGSNGEEDEKEFNAGSTQFLSNTSARGGAIYMNDGVRAYFSNLTMQENSSSGYAGAIYATGEGTLLEINGASSVGNTSVSHGGMLYLAGSSKALLNNLTVKENTGKQGGAIYAISAELTVYNSLFEKCSSSALGGAIDAHDGAVLNAYNTRFVGNTAGTNGGAVILYTAGTQSLIHSCVFEGNTGDYGGALYLSNKSLADIYNITATNNSALKGGFMYETTTGTVVKLVGTTVSGNTASEGGPIIWGNSTGAKLHIDKLKYVDNDYEGDWNDAYWASAIYNSLKVYEITGTIPSYEQYGTGETVEPPAAQSAINVKSASELERALEVGYTIIRITADFALDRTFFVKANTTIYATEARRLTRAADFGGDIFVVGMTASGKRVKNAVLTLGKTDGTDASLIIDGNAAAMTVDVVGTVVLVCDDAVADLGTKLTVQNCTKVGNDRITDGFSVSYPVRVGGAVAIVELGGEMNIYGGSYTNNRTNDITDANTDAGSISSHGGAFYNHGKLNVYGGVFSGNHAGRGGAFYNYRTMRIYGGEIRENTSSTLGGALYMPNSTAAYLYVCDGEYPTTSTVYFIGNVAASGGGAIYARNHLYIANTVFEGNSTGSSYGGAIYAGSTRMTLENCVFRANSAANYGGAIYLTGNNEREETPELIARDCLFEENTAPARAGAVYMSGGARAYFTDTDFVGNTSKLGGAFYVTGASVEMNGGTLTGNTTSSYGGVFYLLNGASLLANRLAVTENAATSGGFAFVTEASVEIYNSEFTKNTASTSGGVIYADDGDVLKLYACDFFENRATSSGGALMIYTLGTQSVIHSCTFERNVADTTGGALYISNKSLVDIYNVTAKNNTAPKGGFMYETTSGTVVKLVGLIVSGNTASEGGAIIWGNTNNAKLFIDKAEYTDLDATGALDDAYWKTAIYNLLTVEAFDGTVPAYEKYEREEPTVEAPKPKPAPTTVDQIFALAQGTGSEYISSKYDAFPVLDNSSNFMSDGVTYFENINGETVTVDSFIYGTKATDGNCTVGEGLLIYQAMLYKQAHPDEDVSIHISAYRVSVEAAVNINRNNRYFGYMRNLVGREYDNNGFVRVSYLLVTAARMGINVTVIGQIDGHPIAATDPNLHEYFNEYLATECDPKYAQGTVGDYMNFAECFWTLDNGKGGTDMMHTKLCAVSHYLDMNGVAHKNAVFTTSSNLDGISSNGTNGNWKLQTGTIVSDHAYLYRISVNYLELIAAYCEQEKIYEFQDLMSRVGAEQIALILDGKMSEIPEDELLVYLGTENDDVFEMYFTPFGGSTAVWDEDNNPYCKYLREMYNSEDSIIFVWNAAEYSSTFPLGDQMEEIIAGAFHSNANVENKFFGNMEGFNAARLEGLVVGENIGYLSLNQYPFGSVHNKDILLSYVKDGQRYYVSLLNSCNMHSGSMSYQSNFMLVIKETECAEDSVFFTMADLTATGIVEHTYGEETSYLPDDGSHGYYYRPCLYCDKKLIAGTIHRPGEWIVDREGSATQSEILHKECKACGSIIETKEVVLSENELLAEYTRTDGARFNALSKIDTGVKDIPSTFEALIKLEAEAGERGGVLIGNYSWNAKNVINLEMFTYGRLRFYMKNDGVINECFFSTRIPSNEMVHVAITVDGRNATLYVDGVAQETRLLASDLPVAEENFCVGGDNRMDNSQYFKGIIYSASIFEDVRTSEEIRKDMLSVSADAEGLLYSRSYAMAFRPGMQQILEGKTFAPDTSISLDSLTGTPTTLEAIVHLPENYSGRGGVIVGNYGTSLMYQMNLEIYENGAPRLYINRNGWGVTYLFNADVRADGPVHIAVTISDTHATLYLNGRLIESQQLTFALSSSTSGFKVGGDNRTDNSQYFKGTIYAVGLYSTVKTAQEIRQDAVMMDSESEDLLYLCYYDKEKAVEDASVSGTTFSPTTSIPVGSLSATPHTIEATLLLPKAEHARAGVIFGNYDNGLGAQINLEILYLGQVRLYYNVGGTRSECIFSADVRSNKPVHIAVTIDGLTARLYVNGSLADTKTMGFDLSDATENFKIGGDNRYSNDQFFKGEIYSIYLFNDVRTPEEISADYRNVSATDGSLIFAKELTKTTVVKPRPDNLRPQGQTFTESTKYYVEGVEITPKTFEVLLSLPVDWEGRGGTVIGNYNGSNGAQVNLEIYEGGRVRLFYVTNGIRVDQVFTTDVRSPLPVHIALTVDGTIALLYMDGELAESVTLPLPLPEVTNKYMVGHDYRTYRPQWFKGTIYSVALFGDVRTAEEIRRDVCGALFGADALLYSNFTMTACCTPYMPGNAHVESAWIIDREATKTTNGLKHKECTVCGATLAIKEISNTRKETVVDYSDAAGKTFQSESNAISVNALASAPKTFELLVHLDPKYDQRAGILFGSYDGGNGNGLNVEIYTNGQVRLYYKVGGIGYSYVFTPDIRSEGMTHIALTVDGLTATLYVNGQMKQALTLDVAAPEITEGFFVGNDRRPTSGQYFKGNIYSVAVFDDVRTAEEIALDAIVVTSDAEGVLYHEIFAAQN